MELLTKRPCLTGAAGIQPAALPADALVAALEMEWLSKNSYHINDRFYFSGFAKSA
jgi:hypothetical protein